MVIEIAACMVAGYIFGCFSTAYIVGKANHIDIRAYGSGNAGTTNALRTLGKKAGAITFVGDLLKALIPLLILRFIIFKDHPDVNLYCLYCGLGVVLGHNFPFWLKFKGGKGIAVTTGVFYGVSPVSSIFANIAFILVALVTRYVSLASIVALVVACTWMIIDYNDYRYTIVLCLYFGLAIWQHRKNIVRLIKGTENKLFDKKPLIEENKNSEEGK